MNVNAALENQVFSVTQITSFIKEILETTFNTVTIEGEISNYKPSSAGHIYFTLKDSNSQISAVLFRGNAYKLNFTPKDGDKVRCTGSISVYGPRGQYQLIVSKMEQAGLGQILQILEERKRKLSLEGLFDEAKKKPLPKYPKTIGVVTSPTGAAIRDILQITKRRNPGINVTILPALVQGEGADLTICKMIEIANFYNLCDLLIVGRGGGSLEDLLPFSEESVVRAVASSNIPVISAVGHEIDWALCDYAADKRAATPSAAAEIAIPLASEIKIDITNYKNELYSQMQNLIQMKKLIVKNFNPQNMFNRFKTIYQPLQLRFAIAKDGLFDNLQNKIKDLKIIIHNDKKILESSSPSAIFNRGYSMVKIKETGKVLRNSEEVQEGTELEITPSIGKITAKAIKIEK